MKQILYLPLDADFNDDSPSGHVVTSYGGVLTATLSASPPTIDTTTKKYGAGSGKFVRASSQIATFKDTNDWNLGTGNFTIRFWINFTTHTNDYVPLGQIINVSNRWILYFNCAGNTVSFYSTVGGVAKAYYTATFHPTNGTWYHFEFVRNGSNFYIFQDGTALTLTTVTAIGTNDLGDLTGLLRIGGQVGAQYLDGFLDDIEIAKGIARHTSNFTAPTGAITPDEYTVLYLPMDADFNSTSPASIDTNTKAIGAGSGNFYSSESSYLSVVDSDDFFLDDNDFDITVYFRLRSRPVIDANLGYFFYILGQTVNISNRWGIYYQEGGGKSYILIYSGDGGTTRVAVSCNMGVLATLNQWYKFKFSRVGADLSMYLDDVLSIKVDMGTVPFANLAAPLQVGKDALTSYPHYFDGHLDEIEINVITSQTFTETLNDNVYLVDSRSRQANIAKSDNVSIADSWAKRLNISRYDYIHFAEAIAGEASTFYQILRDKLDVTDYFTKQTNGLLRDYIYITDSYTKRINPVFRDNIYLADSFTKRLSVLFRDSLYFVDIFVSKGNVYFKALSDHVYITDSRTKAVTNTKSDHVYIADSRTKIARMTKMDNIFALSDYFTQSTNINKSDRIRIVDRFRKIARIKKSDSIGITDSRTKTVTNTKSDGIYISDNFTKSANIKKSDGIGIIDRLRKLIGLNKSDSINIADNRTQATSTTRNDYIGIADAKTLSANIQKNDTIHISDTISKKEAYITKQEALSISDSIQKNISQTREDEILIIDALSKQIDMVLRQDVWLVEVFVSGDGEAFFDVRWDYMHVADSSQKTAQISRNDYASFGDSKTTVANLVKQDVVHIGDSLSRYATQIKSDLVYIGDSLSKLASMAYNDIVSFADSIKNEIAFTLSTLFNVSDYFTKVAEVSTGDYIYIADYTAKRSGKNLYDVVAFNDTRQKQIALTFNDVIQIIDRLVRQSGATLNDVVSISDSFTKEADISLSDLVTFTDAWGDKHIDIVVNDKVVFEDIRTTIASMGMSDSVKFTDDHFEIKLKTTDMVSIHLAVRLP
jgi:hypothetical protein